MLPAYYWPIAYTLTAQRRVKEGRVWYRLSTYYRGAQYGSTTPNFPPHPPPIGRTPDAPGLAAFTEHLSGAGPSRPDCLTRGRWGPPHSRGCHGRHTPALFLQ